jgi:hypothetical protein
MKLGHAMTTEIIFSSALELQPAPPRGCDKRAMSPRALDPIAALFQCCVNRPASIDSLRAGHRRKPIVWL